jgi:hypothetical protein
MLRRRPNTRLDGGMIGRSLLLWPRNGREVATVRGRRGRDWKEVGQKLPEQVWRFTSFHWLFFLVYTSV